MAATVVPVAAPVAGADTGADADADGQGAAEAEAVAAGALALAAIAGALALAEAETHVPKADCSIVAALPPETARTIPSVRPSAAGMARGTAIRAARLFRRRGADLCSLSISIHLHLWKTL
jgi:hypothetical protein